MSIDIESGYKYGYQGVSASGNATLGATIYPYSVFADAFLRASCSPSLNYNWGYWLEDPTPPGSTVYDGGVEFERPDSIVNRRNDARPDIRQHRC